MAKAKFYGTGRRKKSIARVYLVPGTGNITINKRDIDEYLGLETLKVVVRQPLVATETLDKFDVLVNVRGGGYTGQAGAIRHGIARALLQADPDYRPVLKKAGYLTRDPRMKERKKYGLVEHHSSANVNYTFLERTISKRIFDSSGLLVLGSFFMFCVLTRNTSVPLNLNIFNGSNLRKSLEECVI